MSVYPIKFVSFKGAMIPAITNDKTLELELVDIGSLDHLGSSDLLKTLRSDLQNSSGLFELTFE